MATVGSKGLTADVQLNITYSIEDSSRHGSGLTSYDTIRYDKRVWHGVKSWQYSQSSLAHVERNQDQEYDSNTKLRYQPGSVQAAPAAGRAPAPCKHD